MDTLLKMKQDLLDWKQELASVKHELIFRRLMRAATKAGFNPDQPRDDQGQWTASGDNEFDVAASGNAAECDFQYKQDSFICNALQSRSCWAQAAERYAACLSGRRIPELRF